VSCWKNARHGGPPVVKRHGPRYGAIYGRDRRCWGSTTSSWITDPFRLKLNLPRDEAVKRDLPRPCADRPRSWSRAKKRRGKRSCACGRHGVTGNRAETWGCPHGWPNAHGVCRGAGGRNTSKNGDPLVQKCTRGCRYFVKLTPNITNVLYPAAGRETAVVRMKNGEPDQHDQL